MPVTADANDFKVWKSGRPEIQQVHGFSPSGGALVLSFFERGLENRIQDCRKGFAAWIWSGLRGSAERNQFTTEPELAMTTGLSGRK